MGVNGINVVTVLMLNSYPDMDTSKECQNTDVSNNFGNQQDWLPISLPPKVIMPICIKVELMNVA